MNISIVKHVVGATYRAADRLRRTGDRRDRRQQEREG